MQKLAKNSVYLQKNKLNNSLNNGEKTDLNIKTFNQRNKVYLRNLASCNLNNIITKEKIGNTIPAKNYFSLSLKNSFSKTTKNSCEKINFLNQYTERDNSIHKLSFNNLLKKRKTLDKMKNISNPYEQKINQRNSNNNIFPQNIKNNSYDTKNIIITRFSNYSYPEKLNEKSIDFVNDSTLLKKKKKNDKNITYKEIENDINFKEGTKISFNYKSLNNDSLIKQKLINKMKIYKNNSNVINGNGFKDFSYLNISNISNDNKKSNIQLYGMNKKIIKNQSNNNGHYYNMSLRKYKIYNNNLTTNSNNNIFDDSNIKKIKVNINNNLNKSKNKNNKKKNSLNKTISKINNINEDKNNDIQRNLIANKNNINNRYNTNIGSQIQNYNSKRDIFHEEYTNLVGITPRINKCNTPDNKKIYNTKSDLGKSIDHNLIYQIDNQNNDIYINNSTEKNKNIYQILYKNEIGKNLLNINRNNEWTNIYYSINSNNFRKSNEKLDLNSIKNYKNENDIKTNDFLAKEEIENIKNKNRISISDYSFLKKKNSLDVFKSNDNIYSASNNTRKIINFENFDENRDDYNFNDSIKTPKLFLSKTKNEIYNTQNNDINFHIITESNSIDIDPNEKKYNSISKDKNGEYYYILNNYNDNSSGIKLYLPKNDIKYNRNINNYFNFKKIANQNKNPRICLYSNNNNNGINVNRNNGILKTYTENCFNIFLNNDNFYKKFLKKNKTINISFLEKENNSNMNEKDANINKVSKININNEENNLKNINEYKLKMNNNQAYMGRKPSYLKSSFIKYNDENNLTNKMKNKSYKSINSKNIQLNNNNNRNDNNNNMNKNKLFYNNSDAYLFNQNNFNNLNEKLKETINNNNKNINIYINKSIIDSFRIQPQFNPNLNMINYYNQINISKPLVSTNDSINFKTKNRTQNHTPKNIYKKPNCTQPRTKSKTNDRLKIKMTNNKITKNDFVTTLKRRKGSSKSVNLEFNFNIFPPFYLKNKEIKNYLDYMDKSESNKKLLYSLTPKNNIVPINLYDNKLLNEKKKNHKYYNHNIDNARNPYEKNINFLLKKDQIETNNIDKSINEHSIKKSNKDIYSNSNHNISLKNKVPEHNNNETFPNNNKKKYNPKIKNQPLLFKITDKNSFKNIKFNKDIKSELNDFRNKTKNYLNNLKNKNLDSIRNEDTLNPIKIFNKQNNNTNNTGGKKIIDSSRLNKISIKNIKTADFIKNKKHKNIYDKVYNENYLAKSTKENKLQTTKMASNGIYIKPNYIKSRSNSRGSKIHSKNEIEKEEQSLNKLKSKSINVSFDNMRVLRNKFPHSLNSKLWHSTNSLFHTSFEIKSKKNNKNVAYKKRDFYLNSYCFISKYYNYSIKLPCINICYFGKNGIKNFNKENNIQNILNKNGIYYNSNRNSYKAIETLNKNKSLRNINKKNILSDVKENNEDEKLSESSQNVLFVTFNDLNNLRKKNTDIIKTNELFLQYNKDIANDESDLEIYQKLDILKNEPNNNLDGVSQNEEIKFNFSDKKELRGRNKIKSLYYSNKIKKNSKEKEVEYINEKANKVNTKSNIDKNCNLKKAEKGLKILGKIAVRRGHKNENQIQIEKYNIENKKYKKNERIFKKHLKNEDLLKKNSNESLNDYNSVNKNILKGIVKLEQLFNKKGSNSNLNYCSKKNVNFSDKSNYYNTNKISDYNDEIKQKMRTYLHKIESNAYFSNYKILENNEDNTNIFGEKYSDKSSDKNEKNEIENKCDLGLVPSYKKNIYLSKENLLNKEAANQLKKHEDSTNDNKNIISNKNNTKYYLEMSKEYQSKNIVKYKIIDLLNILTKKSYNEILNKIADILLFENNDKDITSTRRLNSTKDIINNQEIFKYEIVQKGISENIFSSIYAKLCNDLDNKITASLAEKDIKINKEKKLKYIINEECINLLNKYKDISKNNFNTIKKESDEYYTLKKNIFGYTSFIYELINKSLLKQQFGYNVIEQFFKIYNNRHINDLIRFLYLEACINLVYNLGKEVKSNEKCIQTLNNYINNNLSNIINNNENIPNHLKYKIIKIIQKNKKLWNNSFSLKDSDSETKKVSSIKKNIKNNENEKIIEEDLINYITYSTELDNNGQIIIKNNFDKSYNWKYIDELINEKNYGLQYFINNFIKICTYTIKNENQLIISNDYIKNIIEYYSNNLSNQDLDLVQREMIKTFFNIDDFVNNNIYMVKILGNLLFVLIDNKLYHIKYFNKYLKLEKKTQINLAIITKYCIISSGKFAKRYFNDFKQTKLFINSHIFEKYVNEALKDLFYFIK